MGRELVSGLLCSFLAFHSFFFFFSPFSVAPAAYGSSQVRSQIRAGAEPYVTTTATWHLSCICNQCHTGSLTHWMRPGIEPTSSWRRCQVLNWLSHHRNSLASHSCWKPVHELLKEFSFFFSFFFVFLPFLGPLPKHMEVPRLGVELEL